MESPLAPPYVPDCLQQFNTASTLLAKWR